MENDLICSLTRQVKEEVIENYLTERCLIGFQMEDLEKRAEEVRQRAVKVGRRLSRLAFLMTHKDMLDKLVSLLKIEQSSFWCQCLEGKLTKGIRFIRVRALTDKGKFRKLVLEAYSRLYKWMENYRQSYEDLEAECRAVNSNISKFQSNFDLLTILSFLKNLDSGTLERKQYLGENFTAEEMASIDQKLYLHPVSFEKMDLPQPVSLPTPERIEEPLSDLAHQVYRKYQMQVKRIMQ